MRPIKFQSGSGEWFPLGVLMVAIHWMTTARGEGATHLVCARDSVTGRTKASFGETKTLTYSDGCSYLIMWGVERVVL